MLSRWLTRSCPHKRTLVVTSVSVRRTVCEACGHVSFTMTEPSVAEADEPYVDSPIARVAGF